MNPNHEQAQFFKEIILTFVSVMEHKDSFIRDHSKRVASDCVLFSRHLSMPKEFMDVIYLAGLLHDIGMIYLPTEMIHQQDHWSAQDLARLREHPKVAEKILSNISSLKNILGIIRHHHENYGGNGYPDGLKGEDIPLGARILSIVDSYDTMTAEGMQRAPLRKEDALEQIHKDVGMRFDPRLVNEFMIFHKAKGTPPPSAENPIMQAVHEVVEGFKKGRIELPVFPAIIHQIREAITSSHATIDDLATVIGQDPVVTLRLITVANSVHYGGGGKIQTARQAVARIGVKDTQDIISTIAMKSVYAGDSAPIKTVMEKMWRHSLATAYAARIITVKTRGSEAEMLFLLGLTHDIGKVLLLHSVTKILRKGNQQEPLNLEEILSEIHAVHAGFSGALLQRWGFADNLVKAVATHEAPELSTQTPKMILTLYLANMLTRRIGYSLFTDQPPDIGHAVLLLGLDVAQVDEILDEVKNLIKATISSL